ncbi:hypothetical protein BaRGS_00004590 [Batillaria attramentaria]|uniref:CCD97-like C-terminal domain-containing protein n=1 Tax=Batillaria attramentaria TaxID=370345 RepID=A0ABD0LYN5_9CAEN
MEPSGTGRRTLYSTLEPDPRSQFASTEPLSAEEKSRVRRTMLDQLSTSAAHFAHRQRDAPDLTSQEKVDIAAEILDKNPAVFLARFGPYLQASDLLYFQDIDKNNYEVQFHLRDIEHRCSHSAVIVKNRRFAAMQELEAGGEYFSEDEMKHREPLLYEQMVGQYLTEEEQQQKADDALDPSDCRLSTILLKHMENVQEKSLYKQQKDKEECQEEESEESSEEDEDKEDADSEMEEDEEIPEISNERATDIWRQQLRSEFKSLMQEKFMSGKDADFDYSKIDSNPEYDSLTAEGQDDEDRYFFTENPGNAGSYGNSDGDMDCAESQSKTGNTGKDENDDEEEDYMKYEPSAELVSKSMRFKSSGSWVDGDEDL